MPEVWFITGSAPAAPVSSISTTDESMRTRHNVFALQVRKEATMSTCREIGLYAACLLCAGAATAAELPTLAESAAAVCKGTAKSEQLVSAAVERAKAASALNAIITLDEAGATAAAQAVDKSSAAARCRPLAGVPIVVKDNIQVAGLPSTAGTPALKGFVPKADAPVVKRLRDAGAIVVAKTSMHELAFGVSGYNPAFQGGAELGVTFEGAKPFALSAEMLRVMSPSAEVQGHSPEQRVTVGKKRNVKIKELKPVGNYAVRIVFDDGHDTGLYAWSYLQTLHAEREKRWGEYLSALAQKGLSRG